VDPNLVDQGNGKFNLMILCWGEGHGSSIHDHTDSYCFLKMLQGNCVYLWRIHVDIWQNQYNIVKSRFNARYWMLGAGALGRPRGMVWGGRREEGSGWLSYWSDLGSWDPTFYIIIYQDSFLLKNSTFINVFHSHS